MTPRPDLNALSKQIIEARNNDGYQCQLKASFSQDLVNQLINIYFPKGSLVYDPFTGIGTTQLSCIENYCDYIGSELVKDHYEIALKRVEEKKKRKRFNQIMTVDRKHTEILDRPDQMWAEGTAIEFGESDKFKPKANEIENLLKAENWLIYDLDIWYDSLQGFWRWSCKIARP